MVTPYPMRVKQFIYILYVIGTADDIFFPMNIFRYGILINPLKLGSMAISNYWNLWIIFLSKSHTCLFGTNAFTLGCCSWLHVPNSALDVGEDGSKGLF